MFKQLYLDGLNDSKKYAFYKGDYDKVERCIMAGADMMREIIEVFDAKRLAKLFNRLPRSKWYEALLDQVYEMRFRKSFNNWGNAIPNLCFLFNRHIQCTYYFSIKEILCLKKEHFNVLHQFVCHDVAKFGIRFVGICKECKEYKEEEERRRKKKKNKKKNERRKERERERKKKIPNETPS